MCFSSLQFWEMFTQAYLNNIMYQMLEMTSQISNWNYVAK
jgi:hypothetical protein